jgi:hypothetical protein
MPLIRQAGSAAKAFMDPLRWVEDCIDNIHIGYYGQGTMERIRVG